MLDVRLSSSLVEAELAVEGVVALAGPSGAGKTTLLRMVAGLARPSSGLIACGGETWFGDGVDLPAERRRCGFVFQHHALFPHMSALGNVAYGAHGDRSRAAELLDRLGIARTAARPRDLSGGERQRVALARALASDPKALLLDEPLASLDPRTRGRAARELADLLGDIPTIVVTHDFGEAALLASEVAVLDRGRIAQRGTPSELASSPASGFVADFTGAVVLTGTASPGAAGLTRVDLDGGGTIVSTDAASGRVAVSVHPWDVTLGGGGSAHNRLSRAITTITRLGNRTRIGLGDLTAEVTTDSAARVRVGEVVEATWKAAATRLLPL